MMIVLKLFSSLSIQKKLENNHFSEFEDYYSDIA